jgi:hypothetical protein
MMKRRRTTKTLAQLRLEHGTEILARGLFLGWSTAKLATTIKAGIDTTLALLKSPEVQTRAAEYEREQFETLDRRFPYCLKLAMDQLIRQFEARRLESGRKCGEPCGTRTHEPPD